MNNAIVMQKIPAEEAPWDLLLLADPSREQIAAYLYPGGGGNRELRPDATRLLSKSRISHHRICQA